MHISSIMGDRARFMLLEDDPLWDDIDVDELLFISIPKNLIHVVLKITQKAKSISQSKDVQETLLDVLNETISEMEADRRAKTSVPHQDVQADRVYNML